ncbi:MAG: hypothetical protein ACEY26_00205 [Candidatus Hodgkinia cicadicola]
MNWTFFVNENVLHVTSLTTKLDLNRRITIKRCQSLRLQNERF